MSQDFAAISSATLAALLILALAELQATGNQINELRARLLAEHAAAIKVSFEEFYSSSALSADEKMHVERELHRWRTRQVSGIFASFWRAAYGLVVVTCVVGLILILRWSALARHPKGYHTAFFALLAIGYSGAFLILGYYVRNLARQNTRLQEQAIALSGLLDVPNAGDAAKMFRIWALSDQGDGLNPGGGGLKPFAMVQFLQRHHWRSMR
ncbi:hypothetical protein ABT272_41550 [Streptomyces sp900105245]|uniref:Uncharacterized protein n=1 Tax=Streptomyces sp. 900105245 TaxID=3154379 RepID=A0ABV1UKB7_9ACTN